MILFMGMGARMSYTAEKGSTLFMEGVEETLSMAGLAKVLISYWCNLKAFIILYAHYDPFKTKFS